MKKFSFFFIIATSLDQNGFLVQILSNIPILLYRKSNFMIFVRAHVILTSLKLAKLGMLEFNLVSWRGGDSDYEKVSGPFPI